MNKRIVHDALILTAFTLVLGLVLALVYGVTKAPIEAANQAAAQQAYMAVFEEADSFEAMERQQHLFRNRASQIPLMIFRLQRMQPERH